MRQVTVTASYIGLRLFVASRNVLVLAPPTAAQESLNLSSSIYSRVAVGSLSSPSEKKAVKAYWA
jgi:hypothetical protein